MNKGAAGGLGGGAGAGSGPTAAAAAAAAQKRKTLVQRVEGDIANIVDNFSHFLSSLSSFISRFNFFFFFFCLFSFSHFAISVYSPAASTTELDAVSAFSEIVPDTVVFDDFEK